VNALLELARRFACWEATGDAAGLRTFDALGAFVAGSATAEGRALAESLRGWESGASATVVRGVATIRMTELDDIHMRSCTTPGAVVVPTAVALGAALGVGAASYQAAVEVGYEAMTRLGMAIGGARLVYRGIWPTYFCAPFAAAAVAAALLELDVARITNALGIALTRATGLTSGIAGVPLARWLTVGDAARAGSAAAFAARDGFVADVDPDRIAAAAGIEFDTPALAADSPAAIEEVSVKPFPTAKQSLAGVEAALRLRSQAGPGRILVHVPTPYAHMVGAPPIANSRLSRISSARWNVALALLRPEELHDIERARPVDDPELGPIAANIEVVADPGLDRLYPARWPARVELSGLSETVVDATGDPPHGSSPATIDAKWRERPERLQPVREAAFAADLPYLKALLDSATDRR
jgi:2-methylcitrate dehydratase PrpD